LLLSDRLSHMYSSRGTSIICSRVLNGYSPSLHCLLCSPTVFRAFTIFVKFVSNSCISLRTVATVRFFLVYCLIIRNACHDLYLM
jgi:hypothetical protein